LPFSRFCLQIFLEVNYAKKPSGGHFYDSGHYAGSIYFEMHPRGQFRRRRGYANLRRAVGKVLVVTGY
jgi:hypothetical protein